MTSSNYSVDWFCNKCGAGWDDRSQGQQCPATPECSGVAEGIGYYAGPAE